MAMTGAMTGRMTGAMTGRMTGAMTGAMTGRMTGGISSAPGRRGGRARAARVVLGRAGAGLVAVVGILSTTGCTPAPPPPEETVTETAALRAAARGQLRDVNGAPIAGARVEARPAGGGPIAACDTTSADGSFSLKVRAGTYDLRVAARSGFAPQSFPAQTLSGTGMLELILLPISATSEVAGRILDRHGNPLAGQQVCSSLRCDQTAADGTFHLIVDDAQPRQLTISGSSSTSNYLTFDLSFPLTASAESDGEPIDIVLPLFDFTGQVIGADGAPVAGASMYVPPCYPVSFGGFEGHACLNGIQADATGHFRALALPGQVSLVVYGPGGTFVTFAVEGDTDVTIDLPALQRLNGQVVDRDGIGQEGISTCLTHAGCFSKTCSPTCTRTDSEGRYQLEVAAGDYVLSLSLVGSVSLGQIHLSKTFSLSQPTQLDVQLPTVKLAARVLDSADLPMAGVQVFGGCYEATIEGLTGEVCGGNTITDADGRFQFKLPAPGTETLQILGAMPWSSTISVSEDTDVVLHVPAPASGQLLASGQLIDADGHALPGATVCYTDQLEHTSCALVDADGHYALMLVPGTYAVSASSFQDIYRSLGGPSVSVPSPPLTLQSAARQLQAQLIDGAGDPIAGATIYVQCTSLTRDGHSERLCGASEVTDGAGRFHVDYLPGAPMGLEIDLPVAGIGRRISMDDVTAVGTATALTLAIQPAPLAARPCAHASPRAGATLAAAASTGAGN
jgi:Carboxypeptidase regulatory-like domain